jgi:beta-glucuronidase
MNARWLVVFALLGLAMTASAATRIDLNRDWSFRVESGVDGVNAGWPTKTPVETSPVDLPHSWNRAGKDYQYLGTGWYFRKFDLPKLPADAIVQLHFGAAFYKARVWLNGVEIGAHEGGYSAFSFEISRHLRRQNVLVVSVDNRPGMYTIPGFGARGAPDAWYDWWAYGGLVRDVWINVHGPIRIGNQFIRSKLEKDRATVTNRVTFFDRTNKSFWLHAFITAPGKEEKVVYSQGIAATPEGTELKFSVTLKDIQRWDLDHPNLYRMTLKILDGDQVVESASEWFGLREVQVANRQLFINGKRVRLTGMTRHTDSPWDGLAESPGTLRHDWEDMKSLNMTLTRPVHYAPGTRAADFSDRRGILLIPEIPIWQASEDQLSNPQYLALAKQQMRELIEQYGNHPSVFAWSVLNESAAGTPGGIAFFREMRKFIKEIDPERYVTLADDNLPKLDRAESSAANDADFLMMNQYFGAWHGPREALGPALDKVDRLFPDKMVIISELGFPGIFAKNPTEADAMRVSILREQMPLLASRDWIAGAILWCYQDYKSRRYFWPGQEQGYLEHGIVDADRQRKPSYFAWKELNEPARVALRWKEADDGEPRAFAVDVTPNEDTQLPFFPMRDYRLTWQLVGAENRAFASGSAAVEGWKPQSFSQTVPAREKPQPFRLVVKLLRPDGSIAMERSLASN